MKQPQLHQVPLPLVFEPGKVYMTMSKGQWDNLLAAAYQRGHMLLEVNRKEVIVKAYQMQPAQ